VEVLAGLGSLVPLEPSILGMVETSEGSINNLEALGALANADNLSGLNLVGCDVDALAVNNDMFVEDELTGSGTCGSDAKTINYIVETRLEELEKVLTGNAFGTFSLSEQTAELVLEYAISIFGLLLLLQLRAIFGELTTAVGAVLARRI
jgi:hypothetical protein